MSLADGYYALGAGTNTVKGEFKDIPESEQLPELELSMTEEELLSLEKKWTNRWSRYAGQISGRQQENEKYWKGKFNEERDPETRGYDRRPISDNQVFTALETFLPIATRQNPEPLVDGDGTEQGNKLADNVRRLLIYQADRLSFKLQLKKVARYWSLYMLGVMKVGWSAKKDDIGITPIRPQRLIMDPNATIENGVYLGEYIGEDRADTAANLKLRFPKKSAQIDEITDKNDGTELGYREWWTNEYVFWTLGKIVLDKKKNPHWNYEREVSTFDDYGVETKQMVPGTNHFEEPQMPYVFLSIFNLGQGPYDQTSLITQIVGLQDLVDKRLKQIDRNADGANGGVVVSGDIFTKEQAAQVAEAVRNGGTVVVPGNVNEGYKRDAGTPLPNFVYQSLLDYRNEIRNIFGVNGSTPQGTRQEQTVRGKIIARSQDTDRIGGGFTEYLEQFADRTYNWMVQLMVVYYDEPKMATVIGPERSREAITIKSSDFKMKLTVSVKENSMVPKDPLTKRNEAIDLFQSGALDPITLFEALEFPNPRQAAERLYIWKSNPGALFPELAAQQAPTPQMQPAPGGPPVGPPQGQFAEQMNAILGQKMPIRQ